MVKIWKIGSWPGLWGKSTTRKDKVKKEQRFISEYALEYNFVALGSAYVSKDINELLAKDKLRDSIVNGWSKHKQEKLTNGKLTSRVKMLSEFAKIKTGEIILLYFIGKTPHNGEVYVGKAINKKTKPYYYVKRNSNEDMIEDTNGIHIAPHRVAVEWLRNEFEDQPLSADFSGGGKYIRRICPILEEDLEKTIKSKKLRRFLERKLAE